MPELSYLLSVSVYGNAVYLYLRLNNNSVTTLSFEYRNEFFVRAGSNIKYFVCITNADICIIECTGEYFQKEYCYYSKFVNNSVAECGLVIGGKYYKFKKFEQGIMKEYKYKYRNGCLEDRTRIYKGEYVPDPVKHYPRKEATPASNPSEIISGETKPTSKPADITSRVAVMRKEDSVTQTQSQFGQFESIDGGDYMSRDNFPDASWKGKYVVVESDSDYHRIPDNITRLQFKIWFSSKSMTDILIGNHAYDSLVTLVFGDYCQNSVDGTRLEISTCPHLKTIKFGKEAFRKYKSFLFVGMICSVLSNRFTPTCFYRDGIRCFSRK